MKQSHVFSAPENTCQTCGIVVRSSADLFVYALAGVPMTVGNCRLCFEAGAYPWDILIGNTASIGGMKHAADWWKDVVRLTLARLGKTRAEFLAAVEADAKAMDDVGSR